MIVITIHGCANTPDSQCTCEIVPVDRYAVDWILDTTIELKADISVGSSVFSHYGKDISRTLVSHPHLVIPSLCFGMSIESKVVYYFEITRDSEVTIYLLTASGRIHPQLIALDLGPGVAPL